MSINLLSFLSYTPPNLSLENLDWLTPWWWVSGVRDLFYPRFSI